MVRGYATVLFNYMVKFNVGKTNSSVTDQKFGILHSCFGFGNQNRKNFVILLCKL